MNFLFNNQDIHRQPTQENDKNQQQHQIQHIFQFFFFFLILFIETMPLHPTVKEMKQTVWVK